MIFSDMKNPKIHEAKPLVSSPDLTCRPASRRLTTPASPWFRTPPQWMQRKKIRALPRPKNEATNFSPNLSTCVNSWYASMILNWTDFTRKNPQIFTSLPSLTEETFQLVTALPGAGCPGCPFWCHSMFRMCPTSCLVTHWQSSPRMDKNPWNPCINVQKLCCFVHFCPDSMLLN